MEGEQNYFTDSERQKGAGFFICEVMPMGMVLFLIGMIIGCAIGGFLLALVAASRSNDDEVPDDTDREG